MSGYNEEILLEENENKTFQKLLQEEREVVLIMDDKNRIWKASCSSPTYMRKFEKQGWKCTGENYYKDGTVCTKFYEAPCKSISIGRYERPKRIMTDEQKEKLKLAREKAKQNNTPQI